MRTPARLGLVSYLNARPLGYGLCDGRQRGRFKIIEDVPSALADQLAAGTLDLALVPSVEYARARLAGRADAIVPGIGIAARGASDSVLLFSRGPAVEARSIAVDVSSRTSVALLRLLFQRFIRPQGPAPELVVSPPDLPTMLARSDAALVIGDRALFARIDHPELVKPLCVLDLGSAWMEMTGLPFVFAFWAGPGRSDAREMAAALDDSLEEGRSRIPQIARERAAGMPAVEEMVLRYLTATMQYRLEPSEMRGLELFYRLLAEEEILHGPRPELVFHPVAAPSARSSSSDAPGH